MVIFSKSLSKTDIEKRLSVPSKSMKHFPLTKDHRKVDIQVKDAGGQVWNFRCYTGKKHLKPVLITKGWREFVRSRKLKIGDKVKFYKEEDKDVAPKYYVRVERVSKIMGITFVHSPIWQT